jgi:cell wall-associated NlpC family hydrolase
MARPPLGPLLLIGAGAYLAWFGVHYWDSTTKWPTDPLKAVLTGKPVPAPSGQQPAQSVATAVEAQDQTETGSPGAPGTEAGVSSTGSQIAADGLKYVGHGYVWGGPSNVSGGWDCSSFASYVLGHDLQIPIPGGSWADVTANGAEHGPTTDGYLLYGTPVNLGDELAGDLVVTSVHMGIVIGGGKMVSAQDPQLGTGISSYQSGFPGGTPFVRRAP